MNSLRYYFKILKMFGFFRTLWKTT